MKHSADYWQRQLKHCEEAIAQCEQAPTPQQLADAEAVLAARPESPQEEFELKVG